MEGATPGDARVVDQDVDGTHAAFNGGHASLGSSAVADVEGLCVHCETFTSQHGPRGFQAGRVAAIEHECRAGLPQGARQCEANAAGRTGDKGDAAVQPEGVGGAHAAVFSR